MDLLERARALAACPLLADLAPAAVIRLAERARPSTLEPGERRTTDDAVWVVAEGSLAIVAQGSAALDASVSTMKRRGSIAGAGHVVGLVRVVAPGTPVVNAVADRAATVLSIGVDDMRDVLEEDPAALAAIAAALARALVEDTT
ncbi:MAG TPA: cyclic nucleotide-binding domain-containing protein [Kofleriaceae bacterium]|nr:cyclic nucleotide-binding domain-containing protein [Kofleriaceae bacterium]